MKTLFAMALLLLSAVASASEPLVADAAYGALYSPQKLVLTLPDDASKPYLTVFGHGPKFEHVQKWFETGELAKLKAQSHYAAIDTTSALFRDNYKASTPGKLTIRFQSADGTVFHEIADGQIGLSAESFIRQTNAAECFRRRSQPEPTPPVIVDPPAPPVVPPSPPKPRFPWLLLALSTTIGCLSGVGYQWHKSTK